MKGSKLILEFDKVDNNFRHHTFWSLNMFLLRIRKVEVYRRSMFEDLKYWAPTFLCFFFLLNYHSVWEWTMFWITSDANNIIQRYFVPILRGTVRIVLMYWFYMNLCHILVFYCIYPSSISSCKDWPITMKLGTFKCFSSRDCHRMPCLCSTKRRIWLCSTSTSTLLPAWFAWKW